MISKSSNADIADWSLELDQRVSSVVRVRRAGLAAGTEIGIVADSALVSITLDVCLSTIALIAKRAVTVDTVVASLAAVWSRQGGNVVERLVNGHKSVARVDEAGVDDATCAEVPVWAVEALVTNTIDVLLLISYCRRKMNEYMHIPCHIHHR
jgi:hypothetical protein